MQPREGAVKMPLHATEMGGGRAQHILMRATRQAHLVGSHQPAHAASASAALRRPSSNFALLRERAP